MTIKTIMYYYVILLLFEHEMTDQIGSHIVTCWWDGMFRISPIPFRDTKSIN